MGNGLGVAVHGGVVLGVVVCGGEFMAMVLRWFWRLAYLFLPRPQTLEAYMLYLERTVKRSPFKPSVRWSDGGQLWEVWFASEPSYCEKRTLTLEVQVGKDTGRIVGLTVWGEQLEAKDDLRLMPQAD